MLYDSVYNKITLYPNFPGIGRLDLKQYVFKVRLSEKLAVHAVIEGYKV